MTFLTTHDSALWRNYVNTLFEMVRTLQQCLRKQNDYLLQHELNLMQRGIHCSKYAAVVTRTLQTTQPIPQQTDLPESLFSLIQDLIQRDTVQSVSCPFTDHHVWRLLVGEQVRRAERSGLPLQQAFELNGADGEEALAADIQQWVGKSIFPMKVFARQTFSYSQHGIASRMSVRTPADALLLKVLEARASTC